MNFLVVSRVSIPAKDRTLPCWEYLRSLGHTVMVEHPSKTPSWMIGEPGYGKPWTPNVIISMGVTIMEETFDALKRFPSVPLYCYNWDCYAWVWKTPRPGEYDYRRYGELLGLAREVWVPSACTGRRTTQWWGLTNWSVVLSACPWWDSSNVRDDGYALCCLREIPDPWWGVFERCCEELGIPYKSTKHEVSREEYEDVVAGCRFICAPLYELSTGGLSLMEAYRLGKPVLISDSEWNGGRDYFGDRAFYFRHGDEDDFRCKLVSMFQPRIAGCVAPDHKEWIESNYSDRRMVDDMLRRIEATR